MLIKTEFPVNLFNSTPLSVRDRNVPEFRESERFARAVCRLPLTAVSSLSFAKPSLPDVTPSTEVFSRPNLPPLIRPLRAPGGFTAAQLSRLFDKVIGTGCPL